MSVTKAKISKLLSKGDEVYIFCAGGYRPTKVMGIYEDSLSVREDLLFYDEIGKTWCLHESTAKDYTKKPIKCDNMLP